MGRTSPSFFGTYRMWLDDGEWVRLDINRVATGTVSAVVARLSVCAWWDEPETDEGQSKAIFDLLLERTSPDGSRDFVEMATSDNGMGGEQVVSLDFDNTDPRKPCIDGGYAYSVLVRAFYVPGPSHRPEGHCIFMGRDVCVTCAWDSGTDPSLPDCGARLTPPTPASRTCEERPTNLRFADWQPL